MKTTSQILALLLIAATASADIHRRHASSHEVQFRQADQPQHKPVWHPATRTRRSQAKRGIPSDRRTAIAVARRADSTDGSDVTKTSKDIFIDMAKEKRISADIITKLEGFPDAVYDKLNEKNRKVKQAVKQLWDSKIPDLAKLPEGPAHHKAFNHTGPAPSRKERFIHWAERNGVSADKIQAINALPDSEFDDLRKMSMKDRLVREAELVGAPTGKIDFFKNAPQSLYDELDKLDKEVRDEREQLRAGELPTALSKRAESSAKDRYISKAEDHNATATEIDFLKTVDETVFQKVSDMNRKYKQATGKLWKLEVPDLSAPVEHHSSNSTSTSPRPHPPKGADPKEQFIFWSELRGVAADKLQAIKDMPVEEFKKIHHLPTKEQLLRQAELTGAPDETVNFFNNVQQSIYDEMDAMKTKVRSAHKDLKDGKVPAL
ncbi:hypothetical protein ABW20_dc0106883 [Dactylellina cionopaga]|nr:hypothetical protein ABW20_dc0106883 [Dactylellina cionopaga]